MESTQIRYERTRRHSNANDGRRTAGLIFIALVAAWLVAFIVSNSQTVKVSFVFGHASVSLIWVMVICTLLGALLMLVLPRVFGRRRR